MYIILLAPKKEFEKRHADLMALCIIIPAEAVDSVLAQKRHLHNGMSMISCQESPFPSRLVTQSRGENVNLT